MIWRTSMALDQVRAARVADALYRQNLAAFVQRVFVELHNDGTDYVPNWHIDAICCSLEAVKTGSRKRVVITMPPRCLKSITTAVAFVAWVLGHKPQTKIIVASYGLDLARKHGHDCRRVMESRWYRRLFPDARLERRGTTQDELRTTKGGLRKAVSIGGAVTGHGADIIIIDDLLKAGDASSETELVRAQEFIEGSLLSRFNNPTEGRVVAIQQRLHELDPAGWLIGKGNYHHLNLPAIAEERQEIDVGRREPIVRQPGDLLFPQRLPRDYLDRLRAEMGSATFNMQYQQNPIAPDGSPLRWEWFGTYEEAPERHRLQMVIQSWDTGMSSDPRSDYTVCTTWGFLENKWYLLDLFRDRLDYPDLRKKVLRLQASWKADEVIIEDAATGKPLLHDCRREDRAKFILFPARDDKEVRFASSCSVIEEGRVVLPRSAPWLSELKRELLGFPRTRFDDQVDSVSQFLNWAKGRGFWRNLPADHPILRERRVRRESIPRR
ncbi:phage terminase large subunit [Histidinibacterium aquaticum]|uniref:Phage terminase large subunit n=1 Tax=Histidinibacterium aquaticum TaxID=2613962 RepID=A0A5J5GKE7_9RHOB|nr:phage terminase large subunit [Histidinibacterium aquaticum]KAA9008749.1 phage terminase large subunit [Histidinibacterium aquaticum]